MKRFMSLATAGLFVALFAFAQENPVSPNVHSDNFVTDTVPANKDTTTNSADKTPALNQDNMGTKSQTPPAEKSQDWNAKQQADSAKDSN